MDAEQPQQAESLHTVQVGKADTFGIVTWGPVHVWAEPDRLTWCGRRMKGLRSRGSRRFTDPGHIFGLCTGCSRALRAGRPRAYKG